MGLILELVVAIVAGIAVYFVTQLLKRISH